MVAIRTALNVPCTSGMFGLPLVSGLEVETSGNPNIPLVQGTFNAVLIATMHNTVYLYDADHERPGPEGRNVPLWATWLGKPRPGSPDIDMWGTSDPEWGILGTP